MKWRVIAAVAGQVFFNTIRSGTIVKPWSIVKSKVIAAVEEGTIPKQN